MHVVSYCGCEQAAFLFPRHLTVKSFIHPGPSLLTCSPGEKRQETHGGGTDRYTDRLTDGHIDRQTVWYSVGCTEMTPPHSLQCWCDELPPHFHTGQGALWENEEHCAGQSGSAT